MSDPRYDPKPGDKLQVQENGFTYVYEVLQADEWSVVCRRRPGSHRVEFSRRGNAIWEDDMESATVYRG